jgi:Helix-turn-helix domain
VAEVSPIKVKPIGTEKVAGFRCPGGAAIWDEPVYPDWSKRRGEELRKARVDAGLGLSETCKRLGVKPVEWSGLERGRMVLPDDEHARALESLR